MTEGTQKVDHPAPLGSSAGVATNTTPASADRAAEMDAGSGKLLVAVSGSRRSPEVVRYAAELAATLNCPWEALHVVTPRSDDAESGAYEAADALALAAELGASVARIPAPTTLDGICSHLESSPATDLVLGAGRRRGWRRWFQRDLIRRLLSRHVPARLHLVPVREPAGADVQRSEIARAPARQSRSDYLQTAGAVIFTAIVTMLLRRWLSPGALGLLFLFPVIAASARFGLRQGLLAVLYSVFLSNLLLVEPRFEITLWAPQSWVLAIVLVPVAVYTGLMTSELRRRVSLSDRSAQENANIAAFALNLTRVADWTSTAEVVCSEVAKLMGVQTVLFREVRGELQLAAAQPPDPALSPVDMTALQWAWSEGEEAGSGTAMLADANWQFQPLKTSLGTMAVLGMARDDGRNPVRADQAVLLSTLLAQAALAHERLRLEDQMREQGAKNSVANMRGA
jgi:two-component system sensor histidine kinase KdpD